MAPEFLDRLMSADNKLEELRQHDLPALREQLTQQNEALATSMGQIAQAIGAEATVDRDEANLLAWPAPPKPVGDQTFSTTDDEVNKLVGTLAHGNNVFDFETGQVKQAGYRTEQMSQSLSDMESDAIRSFTIVSPYPVEWYIPGQETGRFMDNHLTMSVEDIEAKKLIVKAQDHAPQSFLMASTRPRAPIASGQVSWSVPLVSVDTNAFSTTVSVGDTHETVGWTSESEVYKDLSFYTTDVDFGWADRVSLHFDMDNATRLEATMYARNKEFIGTFGEQDTMPWTRVPGWWNRDVAGQVEQLYNVEFPYRKMQLDIRSAVSGGSTDAQIMILGHTE